MTHLLYELASNVNNTTVTSCREGYKVDFGIGSAYFDICGTFLRAEGAKGVEMLAKTYLSDKACGY